MLKDQRVLSFVDTPDDHDHGRFDLFDSVHQNQKVVNAPVVVDRVAIEKDSD